MHLTSHRQLDAIANSLYKYIDVATHTVMDVPAIVGVNVGVSDQILARLTQQPGRTAKELAGLLEKTPRTIERYLRALREQGRIQRVGSAKAGHWEVIERPA